jgi:hypothetical protein
MKKKKTGRTATLSSTKPVKPSPAAAPPTKQPAASTTSGFKTFILLVAAIISLFIFFNLDPYKLWFQQRVMTYYEDFKEEKLDLDLEDRKKSRYQTDYIFAKDVTAFFEKRGSLKNILVLVPPSDYFAANGLQIHVPEPAVFYYYAGLKTIWANSPEAAKANWYVTAKDNGLVFDSVINQQALRDTIASFNKYKISL